MKVLLVLICLLFSSAAYADRTYEFHATNMVFEAGRGVPSCGPAIRQRMLNTKRNLLVTEAGEFSVGGVVWKDHWGDSVVPGWAMLKWGFFDPYTGYGSYYALKIITNDMKLIGLLVRHGADLDGNECRDIIRIEGYRQW